MSVHATTEVELVRCYRDPDGYANRQPYDGVAVIEYAHPLCTVTGMHGDFNRTDFADIMRHARERGAKLMIVERASGHGMPWGKPVEWGPIKGWWQIDLTTLPEAR